MGSRSGWNFSLVIGDLIAVYDAVIAKIGFFLSIYCFFSLFDHRPSFERCAASTPSPSSPSPSSIARSRRRGPRSLAARDRRLQRRQVVGPTLMLPGSSAPTCSTSMIWNGTAAPIHTTASPPPLHCVKPKACLLLKCPFHRLPLPV